jgi:PHP family Zn ribbon phosphoesterase
MSWVSFISGGLAVLFAFALFHNEKEEIEMEQERVVGDGFAGTTGRYVTLSCQTCRKLKRHQEIEANLYECSKCKRLVDLRRPL